MHFVPYFVFITICADCIRISIDFYVFPSYNGLCIKISYHKEVNQYEIKFYQ